MATEPENEGINPFDNLAQLHSKGLDYVLKRLLEDEKSNPGKPVTEERIAQLVSEFIISIHPQGSRIDEAAVYELQATILNKLRKVSFETLLEDKSIPGRAKEYIRRILNLDEDANAKGNFERLLAIERDILKDNLTDPERQYSLLCVAFAKDSMKYGQDEKKLSRWQRLKQKFRNAKWPWKKDTEGAVGGAVTGAVKGVILGSGVVITIAIGALAGAIGSSVKAFLFPPDSKK